jgi:hypothetical protein
MRKRSLSMLLIFITSAFAQEPPSEILNIAKEELNGKNFLSSFESEKVRFGCKPSTKLSDVKAGIPIQILRINWELLEAAKDSAPVSSIVEYADAWDVPLSVNGKLIALLTIAKRDGKWKTIGLGGSGLVCGWRKVFKFWPCSKFHLRMIGAGTRLYFNIVEEGNYNLTEFIPFPCPNELRFNKEYLKQVHIPKYKKLTPSSISIRDLKKH